MRDDYTDAEIKQFAMDAVEGKLFTSSHVPPERQEELTLVFMPLIFMGQNYEEWIKQDPKLIFEYLSKASPVMTNGFPCFHSMKYLRPNEFETFHKYVHEFTELRKGFQKDAG